MWNSSGKQQVFSACNIRCETVLSCFSSLFLLVSLLFCVIDYAFSYELVASCNLQLLHEVCCCCSAKSWEHAGRWQSATRWRWFQWSNELQPAAYWGDSPAAMTVSLYVHWRRLPSVTFAVKLLQLDKLCGMPRELQLHFVVSSARCPACLVRFTSKFSEQPESLTLKNHN